MHACACVCFCPLGQGSATCVPWELQGPAEGPSSRLLLQTGAQSSSHALGVALGAGQRRQPLASGAQAGAGAVFISQRKLVIFSCKNPNFQSFFPPRFPHHHHKVSLLPSLEGGGSPSLRDMSSLG